MEVELEVELEVVVVVEVVEVVEEDVVVEVKVEVVVEVVVEVEVVPPLQMNMVASCWQLAATITQSSFGKQTQATVFERFNMEIRLVIQIIRSCCSDCGKQINV